MKKIVLPFTIMCTSAIQLNKDSPSKSEPKILRRTELSVYPEIKQEQNEKENIEEVDDTVLRNAVKIFRAEGCKLVRTYKEVSTRCSKFINTGIAHSYGNYITTTEYLHEEKNLIARFGAVGGGILFGYVLGIRRNIFKRLLYMTMGGTVVSSICYPEEADKYFKQSLRSSRKYTLVGYHFLNGVTKDYGGFELPAFPVKFLSQDLQDTAKKEADESEN